MIIEVIPDNINDYGVFCSKNLKSEGFKLKRDWYIKQFELGWRIAILMEEKKQLGFIKYGPSEHAWRPIVANDQFFIQCVMVQSKADRSKGLASQLISYVEKQAKENGMNALCTLSSEGAWLASKALYEKMDLSKLTLEVGFN